MADANDFTSFLFGNVDEEGNLESDFLDEETKAQLSNLTYFLNAETTGSSVGFNDILQAREERRQRRGDRIRSEQDNDDSMSDDEASNDSSSKAESKAASAVDYAEIDEIALDDEETEGIGGNRGDLETRSDQNDEDFGELDVRKLDEAGTSGEDEDDDEEEFDPSLDIEKPLASMLPEGFRETDVRLYFPEFREGKTLRFSRLFGPGKPNSLPTIWRGVKSRRKAPQQGVDGQRQSVDESSRVSVNEERGGGKGFELDYAPTPSVDQCEVDDELRLMKPDEPNKKLTKNGLNQDGKNDDLGSVAPWRFGPAAYWYDMYGVSADGDGFDYGLKLGDGEKREKKHDTSDDQMLFDTTGSSKTQDSSQESIDPSAALALIANGLSISTTANTTDGHDEEAAAAYPASAFLPITCTRWEDDVVMDGEDIRQDMLKKLTSGRQPICGWIPTQQTRTYESFMTTLKTGGFAQIFGSKMPHSPVSKTPSVPPSMNLDTSDPGANFSIFPPENEHLLSGRWLRDVIIDPDRLERVPEPMMLTLDASEDQMLFGIPEDVAREQDSYMDENGMGKASDRKDHQFTKKSQMILGKVAQRQREEEEEAANQMVEKDPYNLSNDEYYLPKGTSTVNTFGGSMIQHSIPAQNLMRPFFPTYLSVAKLRHFHRWPLKRYVARGPLSKPGFHSVQSLEKHVQKKEKMREQQRLASGGGEMFFMRESEDLSGKDGELIMCEYSEEHPPLIMQPGMATKIKNFYKRKPGKDNAEPNYEYGETAYTHTLPFLGTLVPGESLQALENSLFRAPIYQHQTPETDFLIIRTRHGYYIRNIPTVFSVGQECPCYEVPSPNSKRASNFVRDYLLVFIYRLFWDSRDEPRRIRMEDIRTQAFPHYAESTIRKRLKVCSDFRRLGPGTEANFWVLRDDFRLPSKEEIRAMVTPETCCAYFSMLAAEQRLKDAGYGEKYFFTPEDEDDNDNDQAKMADEIKCAPWNTTRAFISAMKGKCLLDLAGVADPTGSGEGFSYVRVSAKPPKEELPPPVKRTVTGTDADLRKLSLKDAKQLLRDFGVKDDEIKSLTRWEIIDVIRTLSTQQARAGGTGITKFARGSMRYSMAEVQERYKQECQRIFDLQNKVLRNQDELSTDEGESEAEDSDIEEMGKNIETMLTSKRTAVAAAQLNAEEKELREFQRSLQAENASPSPANQQQSKKSNNKDKKSIKEPSSINPLIDDLSKDGGESRSLTEAPINTQSVSGTIPAGGGRTIAGGGRKLRIYRTIRYPDGREHTRCEVVTRPELIEAYVKVRQTKDDAFIKHFAQMDEQYKEEKRREKRRLQDQLRRIRRNEMKMMQQGGSSSQHGDHHKSDKHHHHKSFGTSSGLIIPSAAKLKPEKPKKPPPPPKASLLKMKCSACGGTGHMKTNKNCPLYGQKKKKKLPPTQVALTDEQIEEEMQLPTSTENLVSIEGTKLKLSKLVVEHVEKAKRKSLQLKIPKKAMASTSGGGDQSALSISSVDINAMDDSSFEHHQQHSKFVVGASPSDSNDEEDEFDDEENTNEFSTSRPSLVMKIQNPKLTKEKRQHAQYLKDVPRPSVHRRRVDPRVAMSVLLEAIWNELKKSPEAVHFLQSVNKKKVPDYYRLIERPMDLQKIRMNISKNHYSTREQFLKDLRQMLDNSRLYNGDGHEITASARVLFEIASRRVAEREQKLMKLEKAINPLLDDNDQVAFSFILGKIVDQCKSVPKSAIFHMPVDQKKLAAYYEKIARPMDLGSMEQKCKRHAYQTVAAFERDLELIHKNSLQYNGDTSLYTAKAKEIYELGKKSLDERRQQLTDLEKNIRATKQKALEDAETDSLVTGTSSVIGDQAGLESRVVSPFAPNIDENSNSAQLQQDLQLSEGEEDEEDEDEVFDNAAAGGGATATSSKQRATDFSQFHMETQRLSNEDEGAATSSKMMAMKKLETAIAKKLSSTSSSLPKLEREPLVEDLEEGELLQGSSAVANQSSSEFAATLMDELLDQEPPEELVEDEEEFIDEEDEENSSSRTTAAKRRRDIAAMLEHSDMGRAGRLHTDLAMSDSSGTNEDDEDDDRLLNTGGGDGGELGDDGDGDGGRGDDEGAPATKRHRGYSREDMDFGTL